MVVNDRGIIDDLQSIPSCRKGISGTEGSPISMSVLSEIEPEPLQPVHSTPGLVTTFRQVYQTKSMSGEEFDLLNRWIFLLNFLFNFFFYVTFSFLGYAYTDYDDPTNEKIMVITFAVIALLILYSTSALTVGYCLCRMDNALVRSR
eukprot:Awhi_evm1s14276